MRNTLLPTVVNGSRPAPEAAGVAGWVLYDDTCRFCVHLARRAQRALEARQFHLLPLRAPEARALLNGTVAETGDEMKLVRPDGRILGGADALIELGRLGGWLGRWHHLTNLPGVRPGLRAGYRWLARHRACNRDACATDGRRAAGWRPAVAALPLLLLPIAALLTRSSLPPWQFMWVMAFALYAGCKWLTYQEAKPCRIHPTRTRVWGYFLAWPGMDAAAFLDVRFEAEAPAVADWLEAFAKTAGGSALLRWAIVALLPNHPQLAAWAGMVGIVLLLHFGLFDLLSLAWRRAGVEAKPLMRHPLRADSVAEYWGQRWNTAFHELAYRYTFRPLRRWSSARWATLLVFILSGLVHELAISVPAGGGYGGPTLYFLIQGLAVLVERAPWSRRLGLGHNGRGRAFTWLVTAGPVYLLFHPPFLKTVILPMLRFIGTY